MTYVSGNICAEPVPISMDAIPSPIQGEYRYLDVIDYTCPANHYLIAGSSRRICDVPTDVTDVFTWSGKLPICLSVGKSSLFENSMG